MEFARRGTGQNVKSTCGRRRESQVPVVRMPWSLENSRIVTFLLNEITMKTMITTAAAGALVTFLYSIKLILGEYSTIVFAYWQFFIAVFS